ncbi:MAG: hypothetical protein R3Y40_06645 [Eubacteriales bacterium]
MGKFIDIGEAKNKFKKEKAEDISVCELFDDIREEGRVAGMEEGRNVLISVLHELQWSEEAISNCVEKKFQFQEI